MNLTEQDLDLIEAYRSGLISPDAKKALEQRLQEDKDFRRSVNEIVQTLESLERIRDESFFKHKRSIRGEPAFNPERPIRDEAVFENEKPKKIFPLYTLLRAAIVVGVMITVAVFYWKSSATKPLNLEDKMIGFAQKEFKPYPAISQMQNQPEDPIKSYSKGLYQEAILVWEKELNPVKSPQDSINLFLLSQCYIAVNQPKKAISILEPMYKKHSNYAPKEAGWYLALAYIQDRQLAKAEPLLDEISRSELNISKKAKEALLLMKESR